MTWFTLLSVLLGIAWLPILGHFWQGWRTRRNPISLAIVALVGFTAYTDILLWLYIVSDCRPLTIWIMHGAEIVVLVFFYVSFRWAKHRFGGQFGPEKRSSPEG